MAIWQFDFWIIPKEKASKHDNDNDLLSWKKEWPFINPKNLFQGMLEEEKSWSKNTIQYGKIDETCIEFNFANEKIEEIKCRLDLRTLSNQDLKKIVEYISYIDGYLLYCEEIYPADIETIKKLMRTSTAAKFSENPQCFFDELNKKGV